MRYYQLVIGDYDEEYNTRLVSYLNANQNQFFITRSFSNEEILKQYIKEHSVDILLISPKFLEKDIPTNQVKSVVILSDGKIPNYLRDYKTVYKYHPANNLITEIINYYAKQNNEEIISSNKEMAKIIGVFSPLGRCGKTVFSLVLAEKLAKYKNVIYINLEPFANLDSYINIKSSLGLTDLLYYVRQEHANLALKFESIKENCMGFDFIAPIKCYLDFFDMHEKDWDSFFELIKNKLRYDYAIINFGNHIDSNTLHNLTLCDLIYTIEVPEKTAISQLNNWRETLELLKKDELIKKTKYIVNQQLPIADTFENNNRDYKLLYDECLLTDEYEFNINTNSKWNNTLEQLLRDLIKL